VSGPGTSRGSRDPGYLRQPTIWGDDVVFVSDDDLWLVSARGGRAARLTAGTGEISGPLLSPDGQWLAFTSTHDGRNEVHAMPREGGEIRRLTHQAALRCTVAGWHPDTGEVLYASTAEQPRGFGTRLFAVDPAGSEPRLLPYGPAAAVAHGSSGELVIGRNTADPARWRRYRGGTAGELLIGDATCCADSAATYRRSSTAPSSPDGPGRRGVFRPLVSLPGNLAFPCWAGERIWFVSDHEGTGNVYSCSPDGSAVTRHTHHDEFYVRALSGDGTRLVYQCGARLYLLDPATGGSRPLDVVLPGTRWQTQRRFVTAGEHLDGVRLSPEGARVAVTARGRLLSAAHWEGAARTHGDPGAVRHREPAWLPDGERIAAIAADDRGDSALAVFPAEGGGPRRQVPLTGLGRPAEAAASPVDDLIAVTTTRHALHLVDLADPSGTPVPRQVDHSPHGPIEDLAWSPDGRWLAYTWPSGSVTSAIRVYDVRTGEAHPLTEPVLRDRAPEFSACGRFLYFIGQRQFTPVRDQVTYGVGFPAADRPYLIALRAGTPSPFTAVPRSPADDPPEPYDADGTPVTEIDFAGLADRVQAFPVASGTYLRVLGCRDRALLLSVPPHHPTDDGEEGAVLDAFDFPTQEVTRIATGCDDVQLSADRRTLLYTADGALRVWRAGCKDDDLPPEAGYAPGRATGWLDAARLRVEVHPRGEWRQMLHEAWQLQREHFWDAGMSGVDWEAVLRRYLPLVELVSCRSELSDLIGEMQGELGTSHTYEQGGDRRESPHGQGFLGVDWDTGRGPGRIRRVLSGDPWDRAAASPCAALGVDLRPGDRVVAVGGRPVGPRGVGELLVDHADHEVELTVERDGHAPRRVSVRALGDESALRYRDWVAENRGQVHESTGGRVGYVHVPNMFDTGYTEFVRGFLAEHERHALVVDARFNGGGNLSWQVLERLARRRHGYEFGRWNGALPYPAESVRGPLVALVNEHTGSDGDIFTHMFQRLGLGPVVGRRTWGGVIAAYPRHPLADGTLTTQPEYSYDFDGVGRSLENSGVRPDVEVDILPHDHALGLDPQLTRAVQLALDQLTRRPAHSPDAAVRE